MKYSLSQCPASIPDIPDNLPLWRYMDFPKFLDLISTRSIKMPQASKMEDPWEGLWGEAGNTQRLNDFKQSGQPGYLRMVSAKQELDMAVNLKTWTYISCWNTFDTENAGLWRIYGDDKGLAIRTTWKSLKESLSFQSEEISNLYYGPIKYYSHQTEPIMFDSFTDHYFLKRSEFQHEKEFRLVAHHKDIALSPAHSTSSPPVISLSCNPEILIEELVISPRLSPWIANVAREVCEKFEGSWSIKHSDLYSHQIRFARKF